MSDKSPSIRGENFELRVVAALTRLESIGFARAIKKQERVKDRDRLQRRIDISFILCTWAIELLISIECKSRARTVSLDEIDQIKTFKRELPARNLFWLITEGPVGEHATEALTANGISHYTITELEAIVDDMCTKFAATPIDEVRKRTRMLSAMSPIAYGQSSFMLKQIEMNLLTGFAEAQSVLANAGHYYSEHLSSDA